MQDLADPHARERALAVADEDPPSGVAPDEAVAEVRDVLASIGDTCPECPPIAAGSERRETALVRPSNSPKMASCVSAHVVGSDGHFVGFEPLLGNCTTITLLRPDRPPRPRRARPR